MIRRGFIGIAAPEGTSSTLAARLRALCAIPDELRIVADRPGLLLACIGLPWIDLGSDRGTIIGSITRRDESMPIAMVGEADTAIIAAGAGEALTERWWGSYVAVLGCPERDIALVRSPLGQLPCYILRRGAISVFGSSARAIADVAGAPAVEWAALARQLAFRHLRPTETCLAGIGELAGGERLVLSSQGDSRSTLWSPLGWARRDPAIATSRQAAAAIRSVAQRCVAAETTQASRIVLKLSGGLDSSIVAACLAAAGRDFTCLTLASSDSADNEREYAILVADHLGLPLKVAWRDPGRFDPCRSASSGLPRPALPGFRQVSDQLVADAAAGTGATLILDGGGGDNVFCSLKSAAVVADCLLDPAGRRSMLSTAHSVASLAQASLAHVLRRAVARALRQRTRQGWPRDTELLNQKILDAIPLEPDHPWLDTPATMAPGRAAHVALIVAAQAYVEAVDPDDLVPLAVPLLAQPLVERCLSIPSWCWFDHGLNRAAARLAFTPDLPGAIVRRRSKGSPDAFSMRLFEHHHGAIRDQLLGGLLVRHGVVDERALGIALRDTGPIRHRWTHRLMQLLDAENWARSWTSH